MSKKRKKNAGASESMAMPEIVSAAFSLNDGESEMREVSNQELNDVMNYALAQRYRNAVRISRTNMPYGMKYSKELIFKWLNAPWNNEYRLRRLSNHMYNANGQYMRLCNYQSDMVKFAYIMTPIDLGSFENIDSNVFVKAYRDTAYMLDCMNMRTEFNKPLRTVMRDGVAFAYARSSKDTFSLFMLDPNYCRISSIDGSGCIRFEFDFVFFDRFIEDDKDAILESYGQEFIDKYSLYKNNARYRWQEIGENGLCVKYREDMLEYSIPPYIAVLDNLFDLDDYRKLAKAREETGNYNLLNFTVPSNKDGKILMDLQLIKQFISQVSSEIPDTIGVIYTPMEAAKISFAKDTTVMIEMQ